MVVSGPSHAEETIVRDITLITAVSKDLQTAQYVQKLFSNHYFLSLYQYRCDWMETAGAQKHHRCWGQEPFMDLALEIRQSCYYHARSGRNYPSGSWKLGANPLTYSGLSGVGDLIVTGTSVHSRNWRAGDVWRGEAFGRYRSKYGNGH